jgi:hypothetical protein
VKLTLCRYSFLVAIQIEGNRIPEAAKHRIHLAASYTWNVAGGGLSLTH